MQRILVVILSGSILTLLVCVAFFIPIMQVLDIDGQIAAEPETMTISMNETAAPAIANQSAPAFSTVPKITDPNLEVQLVFRGLQRPTTMGFLGLNDILVLEKNDGTVRRIVNGAMLNEPVLDVDVANLVERGMLGIAISKNQDEPRYVFLYFTESAGGDGADATAGAAPPGNRLYRYEFVDGKLVNGKMLLNSPAARGASHNGGALLVGPDNNIYLSVGDVAAHKTRTQNYHNSTAISGTSVIFRLTQEGESAGAILDRNSPANKFFAFGVRNSFGMDFDPLTGKLWDTENGPHYGDEINLVEPGFNSGWATITGSANAAGNDTFNEGDLVSCLYCTGTTGLLDTWINKYFFGIQEGKYSEPEFTWRVPVGPTGITFLTSDKLGERYENDIFVTDVVPGNIYHFELNENRDALVLEGKLTDKIADSWDELEPIIFAQGFGGITDLDVGPDGYLYFLTHYRDPSIYRIVPAGTPPP